jgi:hypothetical protein
MSIEVQCPNPDCGKVHKAKDKYAGMPCYCPDCRAIMDVPPLPGHASAPTFEPFAADASLAEAPAHDTSEEHAAGDEAPADDAVQLEAGPPGEEEEQAKEEVLLAELEAEEVSEPAPPAPKPKRRK